MKPKKPLTPAQRERLAELLKSFETIRMQKKQPRRDVLKRASVSTRDWHFWNHSLSQPNAGQRKRIKRALDKMPTLAEWPRRLGRKPKLTEAARVEIRQSGESVAAMAKRLRVNASTVYRAIRGRK